MTRFKITYRKPETELEGYDEDVVEFKDFEDTLIESTGETITAKEWAWDYAYNAADKGPCNVEEVTRG